MKTDTILTPAETRVAIAYTLGDIGKEVAERLGIAYYTVVRHTQNIYEKTGIRRSTNALVAWFLAENYDINIKELGRRIGAGILLLIFCAQVVVANDPIARRTSRRGRRRNEYELFTEE